jgi:hypothetical protein
VTDNDTKLPQIHPPAPDQQPEDNETPSQSCHPSRPTPLKQCFRIDPAIKFPLCYPTEFPPDLPSQGHCWADGLLHLFKLLPGITISVLQDHLLDFLQECCNENDGYMGLPSQIAQHPGHPFGFVITLHRTNLVAQTFTANNRDIIQEVLNNGVYLRQALTPSRRICRQFRDTSLQALQKHLAQFRVFAHSSQPYTVTSDPHIPHGFIVTVCQGNHVALNEDVLDEALSCLVPSRASRYYVHMTPSLARATKGASQDLEANSMVGTQPSSTGEESIQEVVTPLTGAKSHCAIVVTSLWLLVSTAGTYISILQCMINTTCLLSLQALTHFYHMHKSLTRTWYGHQKDTASQEAEINHNLPHPTASQETKLSQDPSLALTQQGAAATSWPCQSKPWWHTLTAHQPHPSYRNHP